MDPTPLAANAPTVKIKKNSCVLCSQRKVKCDRKDPCLNCVKSGAECIPSNPAPPRRRKRTAEVGLHERLQRCEDLLKTYGLSIDGENAGMNQNRNQKYTPTSENKLFVPENGTMISKPGMTRFIESHLWSSLLDELRESKDILQNWRDDESDVSDVSVADGSSLLFSSNFKPPKLTQFHPPPIQILRLWQVFIENVHPVLKIVHTPTLQAQILEASGNIATISKGLETLLFPIYALAIVSLSDEDCLNSMGEPKETLIARYSAATEHALIRLGALESSDLVALQALTLFMVATRSIRNSQSFWLLSGVAIRMGQRMGLHRDGSLVTPKLAPFETEMRRRIWWHVMKLDYMSAIHAGVGPSLLETSWDTKLPGNFNDGDLYPGMTELPLEHTGATEMIYVLMTYDLCQAFVDAQYLFASPSQPSISRSDADSWFNELETRVRHKFLQYCDLSNPLHLLTEAAAISIISTKRLYAHHPRNDPTVKTSEEQQAQTTALFENSMSVLRYSCAFHSVEDARRFQWHTKEHFQYDIVVFLLNGLRHTPQGPVSDEGWQILEDIYKYHPELLSYKANELHFAVGGLVLKAWEARELKLRTMNQLVETPSFVVVLRSQRASQSAKPNSTTPNLANPSHSANLDQTHEYNLNGTTETGSGVPWGSFPYDPTPLMDNTVSTDTTTMDWNYWDNLLKEYEFPAGDVTSGYIGRF